MVTQPFYSSVLVRPVLTCVLSYLICVIQPSLLSRLTDTHPLSFSDVSLHWKLGSELYTSHKVIYYSFSYKIRFPCRIRSYVSVPYRSLLVYKKKTTFELLVPPYLSFYDLSLYHGLSYLTILFTFIDV